MFVDTYREDFDVIKNDLFREEIRYRQNDVWLPEFFAIVEEAGDGEIEDSVMGSPRESNAGPFYVTISKSDVATVNERRDMIRVRGVDLTVWKIVHEDEGAWRLHCAR